MYIGGRIVVEKFHSVERVCGRAKIANPIGRPISFDKDYPSLVYFISPTFTSAMTTNLKEGKNRRTACHRNVGKRVRACVCLYENITLRICLKI